MKEGRKYQKQKEESKNIIELFRESMYLQGLSENTIKNYILDIEGFLDFSGLKTIEDFHSEEGEKQTVQKAEENQQKNEKSKKEKFEFLLQEWILNIKRKDVNNKSVNRNLASLKKFLSFLEEKNFLNISRQKYLRNLKTKDKILKLPSLEEIKTIMNYALNVKKNKEKTSLVLKKSPPHWESFRNYLIIKFLFTYGLRISEACSLKIGDLMNINENQKVEKKNFFIIKGKGSKERALPVLEFIFEESLSLVKSYPWANFTQLERSDGQSNIKNTMERYLFLGKNEKKISSVYMEQLLKKIKDELGLTCDTNPHIFRHCCGTYLLEEGVNIREIQTILGHSSLNTTQKYLQISKKHLLNSLEKIDF